MSCSAHHHNSKKKSSSEANGNFLDNGVKFCNLVDCGIKGRSLVRDVNSIANKTSLFKDDSIFKLRS